MQLPRQSLAASQTGIQRRTEGESCNTSATPPGNSHGNLPRAGESRRASVSSRPSLRWPDASGPGRYASCRGYSKEQAMSSLYRSPSSDSFQAQRLSRRDRSGKPDPSSSSSRSTSAAVIAARCSSRDTDTGPIMSVSTSNRYGRPLTDVSSSTSVAVARSISFVSKSTCAIPSMTPTTSTRRLGRSAMCATAIVPMSILSLILTTRNLRRGSVKRD